MNNPIRVSIFSQDKKTISIVEKVLKKSDEVFLQKKFIDFGDFIKELEVNQEDIDIIIIDITLNGIELLSKLSLDFPNIKKIVITQSDVCIIALDSIKFGVKAILHYTKIKNELLKAILRVNQKKVYFEESIVFLMVDEIRKKEHKREQYRLRKESCK